MEVRDTYRVPAAFSPEKDPTCVCVCVHVYCSNLKDEKSNAIHVNNRGGPYVCETLRLLDFLDNRLRDGCQIVTLMCQMITIYPQKEFLILISIRG
jgi:hypothetical protein